MMMSTHNAMAPATAATKSSKSAFRWLALLLLSQMASAQTSPECFASNEELLSAIRIYFQATLGNQVDVVAFDQMEAKYGTIDSWCTSRLTNFASAFSVQAHPGLADRIAQFNRDLSGWDTSQATDMSDMFFGAEKFNQNIGNWQTGNVTNFERMFAEAKAFDQPVGTWNMQSAENLQEMFRSAEAFNQNLNGWNTPNLIQLAGMFAQAIAFNGDISSLDVSKVADFSMLFQGATKFNSNIGNWQTTSALNFARLFMEASSFNQDISGWQTGQVTDFLHIFDSATSFNRNIGNWDTGSVTNMANAFRGASSFNQDISGWDMSKVSKHDKMFMGASSFNQDLCAWADDFLYAEVGDLFTETACVFTEDPDPTVKGPFCKEGCANMISGPSNPGFDDAPITSPPVMSPPVGDPGVMDPPISAPSITRFPTPPPTSAAAGGGAAPSGPSRFPSLPPTPQFAQVAKRKPMDEQTKALIFGIGGAFILAIVSLSTACCGEPAGSKQYEFEMEDMLHPDAAADPNALPLDQQYGEERNDDDNDDYEDSQGSDASPELV